MKVVPISETVTIEAQLRHITKLLEEQREVTRYDMDGRTYLRIRLPECDCKEKSNNGGGKSPDKLIRAIELVTDLLAEGSVPVTDILNQGLVYGISPRTMARAKKALDVPSRKVGDRWYWELPTEGVEEDEEEA